MYTQYIIRRLDESVEKAKRQTLFINHDLNEWFMLPHLYSKVGYKRGMTVPNNYKFTTGISTS